MAFHTLPVALGVSKKFDLVMNSLTVPRKAKQAIGGIARLVNDKGEERYVRAAFEFDPLFTLKSCHDETKNNQSR